MRPEGRILAIAYACSPYQGSEPGVGWGWVNMIARHNNVVVITAERHRGEIQTYCEANGKVDNIEFRYVEHKWVRILDKLFPPYYLWTYNRWLEKAYKMALGLESNEKWVLCHLLTYVGYRHPGKFYKLDCPFVWGPIGGLENTPLKLLPAMGVRGAVYYAMRNIVNSIDRILLMGPKAAFKRASEAGAVIAATSGVQRQIAKYYGVESSVICEVGAQVQEAKASPNREDGETFRISWSGAHLSGKALPLLLNALKQLPSDIDWKLDILGAGPCSGAWRKHAERIGIDERCFWHGKLERSDALKVMSDSHLFVITSLKDLTSSVLLEALACGLPVICPDHCGFRDVVDDSCGIKIHTGDPAGMSAQFAREIDLLFRDENRRRVLADGARARSCVFSWEKKHNALEELYSEVFSSSRSTGRTDDSF